MVGRLLKFAKDSGRWRLLLENREYIRIKPEFMMLCEGPQELTAVGATQYYDIAATNNYSDNDNDNFNNDNGGNNNNNDNNNNYNNNNANGNDGPPGGPAAASEVAAIPPGGAGGLTAAAGSETAEAARLNCPALPAERPGQYFFA
ncbi:unnamed protein product, partial [Polarella glacialis]